MGESKSSSDMKRYMQFALVVFAAGSMYPLIYLKQSYQQTILEVFGMNLTQLNTIYSVLGFVFILGYFPSGWLADKFSAKKLMTVSLFMVGLGGLWFAQIPSYKGVVAIFTIWGIFSVFTFWSSHLKMVKLLSTKEEEGRFFGILDGGRGAIEAILASIAVVIFSSVLGQSDSPELKREALVSVIYMYSILLIVASILVGLFVEPDSSSKNVDKEDTTKTLDEEKSSLIDIIKNKYILTLGGIIFFGYIVTWTIYYFGGFLETNIGVSAIDVGTVMMIVLWMRPLGGVVGGFLADKAGKTKVLSTALIGAGIALVLMSVLPATSGYKIFYILVVLAGFFGYTIRGTYWSLLGDCDIKDADTGVAIGVVSFLGYLPDVFLPMIISMLFATFGDNKGYNAYFILSAIAAVISVLLILVFVNFKKKDNKTA